MADDRAINQAREWIEAFSAGDWERFRALLAPDCVYEEHATHRRLQGPDGISDAWVEWKRSFPDARGKIENAFSSGDWATLEVTWEGTQSGPLAAPQGELPPSNKHVVLKGANVFRVGEDGVKEHHNYWDLTTLLQQVGAA